MDKNKNVFYTIEEISKHNKEGDAWIIIKNMVFDISEYTDYHPGGDIIFDYAGEDGTEAFSILNRKRTFMG